MGWWSSRILIDKFTVRLQQKEQLLQRRDYFITPSNLACRGLNWHCPCFFFLHGNQNRIAASTVPPSVSCIRKIHWSPSLFSKIWGLNLRYQSYIRYRPSVIILFLGLPFYSEFLDLRAADKEPPWECGPNLRRNWPYRISIQPNNNSTIPHPQQMKAHLPYFLLTRPHHSPNRASSFRRYLLTDFLWAGNTILINTNKL